jgi:putative oxidoreductase
MSTLTAVRSSLALTLLRVTVGFVFFMHGYQKIFTYGFDGIISGFGQIGVPMPQLVAPAVGITELVGGAAVILGLFPRVVALLFIGVMAGAITYAKGSGGFFAPNGYEFELTLGVAALTIALAGGGQWSVQDLMKKG